MVAKHFRVAMHKDAEVINGARTGLSLYLNTPQAALLIASFAASEDFDAKPEERSQLCELASKIAGRWSGY